jgi:hypothetical protein
VHTISLRIVNGQPLPATVINADLTPELDQVISRAIAKDLSKRYQTGQEMASDLKRLRDAMEGKSGVSQPAKLPETATGQPSTATHRAYSGVVRVTDATLRRRRNAASEQPAKKAVAVQFDQPWQQMGIAYLSLGALMLAFTGLWWAIPSTERAEIAFPRTTPTVSMASLVGLEVADEPADSSIAASPKIRPMQEDKAIRRFTEATVEGAQASPTQADSCELGIAVEHHFATADLSVWIDDQAKYSHSLRGAIKKRVVLFKGIDGYLSDVVQLAPGDHHIRVRVVSADGAYDESSSISGSFMPGSGKMLAVAFDRHNRRMHLVFENQKSF